MSAPTEAPGIKGASAPARATPATTRADEAARRVMERADEVASTPTRPRACDARARDAEERLYAVVDAAHHDPETLAAIRKLLNDHDTLRHIRPSYATVPNVDWRAGHADFAEALAQQLVHGAGQLERLAAPRPDGKAANTLAKTFVANERAYPGSVSRELPVEGRAALERFRDHVIEHVERSPRGNADDARNTLLLVRAFARITRAAPWVL